MMFPVTTTREQLQSMRYGHAAGQPWPSGAEEISAAITAAQVAYATRYPTLVSELRDPDASNTDASGPRALSATAATAADVPWSFAVAYQVTQLPTPLPGSDSATTSSGGSATTRGSLRLRVLGEGVEAMLRIHPASLSGPYGSTSTIGTPTTAAVSETAGTLGWYEAKALLPSGVASGDDIAICVLYRPAREVTAGVYAGTLIGFAVDAPNLTEA